MVVLDPNSVDPRRSGMPPFFSWLLAQIASLIQGNSILCKFVPSFVGTAYFVSAAGNDANDGLSWGTAFRTLTQAWASVSSSDVIFARGGDTFDENGSAAGLTVAASNVGCYSIGIAKATITNTDATPGGSAVKFTGTAADIRFERFRIQKGNSVANAIYVLFDGCSSVRLFDCGVILDGTASHTGAKFTGGASSSGFVSSDATEAVIFGNPLSPLGIGVHYDDCAFCFVGDECGVGVLGTAVLFGSNSLLCSVGQDCVIQDVNIAYQLNSGASRNIVRSDPLRANITVLDLSGNKTNRVPSDFDNYSQIYPRSTGTGDAISPANIPTDAADETNGPANTRWYWGEPVLFDPGIASEYNLMGITIDAVTANVLFKWQLFTCNPSISSAKNGGAAWDEGTTALTVDDGSLFLAGDIVAVVSDYAVEIQLVQSVLGNVVTIVREASPFGAPNTGLRWDHTINDPGTEVLYRVDRATLNSNRYIEEMYSAASSRDFFPYCCGEQRAIEGNGFVLIRTMNETNSINGTSFDAVIRYR